ncbi:hypothetical protein H5410_026063 [Solanum commersonii]|uniref:Uncharacterized protein n=1 Tax=Solanum commersonii TaxID=4109 RepID=A0A9J5YV07_SOLCO|nr:hypothetical protein H5410_026063 [Solanum commersonii]
MILHQLKDMQKNEDHQIKKLKFTKLNMELQLLSNGFSAMLKLYLSMHAFYNLCLALDLNVTLTYLCGTENVVDIHMDLNARMTVAAGSGNTDFISRKINLLNSHYVHT